MDPGLRAVAPGWRRIDTDLDSYDIQRAPFTRAGWEVSPTSGGVFATVVNLRRAVEAKEARFRARVEESERDIAALVTARHRPRRS
jgi:hypothetical protein